MTRQWRLSVVAALCLASVVLLTLTNYYEFTTLTVRTSVHPETITANDQTQIKSLLTEIREVLRRSQITDGTNHSNSTKVPSSMDSTKIPSGEEVLQFPADHDDSNIHIVFSASCNQHNRLLQQTVVQLTATWVGQKGPITQVLSGCSERERLLVMKEPTFYYDFRRHFTPSFAINPEPGIQDNYPAYNKPFGIRHFLQNAVPGVKHDIIAIIDGDFFFFQALQANTGRKMSKYYHGRRNPATITDTVIDGVALAQDWSALKGGFFAKDKADVLNKVCGGQPCGNISEEDGIEFYGSIGPPYIMTRRDALRMIDDYCHFCVSTRKVSSEWVAEMFAYSLAAANNGVKHTALSHLGISSPGFENGGHEYWSFVDNTIANPCIDNLVPIIPESRPITIHTCQWIGNFYKNIWPKLANCESPIFKIQPSTDWTEIDTVVKEKQRHIRRKEVWAKCTLTKLMNIALIELKQQTCHAGFNTFRGISAIQDKQTSQR